MARPKLPENESTTTLPCVSVRLSPDDRAQIDAAMKAHYRLTSRRVALAAFMREIVLTYCNDRPPPVVREGQLAGHSGCAVEDRFAELGLRMRKRGKAAKGKTEKRNGSTRTRV